MKKKLEKRMKTVHDDPYTKVSLRGQSDREKHANLRALRDEHIRVVNDYDTF